MKRWVLGERMEKRTDGWTGYAGTGGRLTIVSGQEGGHRGPDALGEQQTIEQRARQAIEREGEVTIPCVHPMCAMQFPAGPSVCLRGRACYLRHCSSPFSHTKVNIPAIRMEYNAMARLSG